MKAVILAAGKGTRLMPLTKYEPKPLVHVGKKRLIEHVVDSLPSAVKELVIVIGHMGEMIEHFCGPTFKGRPVTYVVQETQNGTARALELCREHLEGRFLLMFADDIHGAADIEEAVTFERSMLAMHSDTPERFGVVMRRNDGTLAEIIEKPQNPRSNLVSTGVMVLDEAIFDYPPEQPIEKEYFLTEVINRYAKDHPMMVVKQETWIPIATPEDVAKAEEILRTRDHP